MPQTPQSPQTFLADRPIVLHHYPQSPFAEKVRLIFGFKGLKWRSVTIPIIMPKPDLLALTGGYRKTPVLQLGRSIFCDTALIATVLDRLSSSSPLFPDGQRANASIIAAWADSIWFSACVAQAMQPAAFKSLFPGQSDEQLAAFAADRKAMRAGSPVPRMTLESSTPIFMNQLRRLDHQFSNTRSPFLLGSLATVADFSMYHPLWFVQQARAIAAVLDPYPNVLAWMSRIAAFGHGQYEELSSTDAINLARSHADKGDAADLSGRKVRIAATDYGLDPSQGALLAEHDDEWIIARHDHRAGAVHVHFPRVGFAMTPVVADGE